MIHFLKKMPILLSLGTGIILGMFFLYNKRVLTEVYQIIFVSSIALYILGRSLRDNILNSYQEYIKKKIIENNLADKEGIEEEVSNSISEDDEPQSSLDLKVEGNKDDFVELTQNIAKD